MSRMQSFSNGTTTLLICEAAAEKFLFSRHCFCSFTLCLGRGGGGCGGGGGGEGV